MHLAEVGTFTSSVVHAGTSMIFLGVWEQQELARRATVQVESAIDRVGNDYSSRCRT